MASIKLGELLVRANVLQEPQLKAALVEQQRWGGKLGDILVRMSLVTEDIITRALSKQLGVPAINLDSIEVPPPEVMKRVPLRVAEDLHIVPLQLKDEGKTLVVAMTDPLNVQFLDTLRAVARMRIAPVLAARSAIDRALGRFYKGEVPAPTVEEESSFKLLDPQGRTLVKNIAEIEAAGRAPERERSPSPSAPAPPPASTSRPGGQDGATRPAPAKMTPGEQLRLIEDVQRKEVAALKAMVELLVEKGVFSRDEYIAKVRK